MERRVHRRVRRQVAALVLGGVIAFTAGGVCSPPVEAGKKEPSPTKVSATATRPDADGNQVVTVTLEIDKPWHVYANPTGNEMVESNKTTVAVSSKTKLEEAKIAYPPGKPYVAFGEKFFIYEDKVSITARIRRAKGDTGPLDVTITYMNCTDKTCLKPATVKLAVP
jgi:DsbC/DsbD-like thiol-disulfide interchange protein